VAVGCGSLGGPCEDVGLSTKAIEHGLCLQHRQAEDGRIAPIRWQLRQSLCARAKATGVVTGGEA
jgi:hypothetical protein